MATKITRNMFSTTSGKIIEKVANFNIINTDAVSSLELLNVFATDADNYFLAINYYLPITNATKLYIQLSDDSGATWKTSGYRTLGLYVTFGAGGNAVRHPFVSTDIGFPMFSDVRSNASSGNGGGGQCLIKQPRNITEATWFESESVTDTSLATTSIKTLQEGGWSLTSGTSYNSIRLITSSGNIHTLTGTLYKYKI